MIPPFARVIGVDFSASHAAGRGIWLAVGLADRLVLEYLTPACELPGGGVDRAAALERGALIGFDFPFGLPASFAWPRNWRRFVIEFPERHPDPERFRADCRTRARGREVKRRTDREARTPFCAYNLRLYRQTWWGLTGVLAPLLGADAVAAPPMTALADDRPAVVETCPASTLKRLGLYRSYKGRFPAAVAARAAILSRLTAAGLEPKPTFVELAVGHSGGDALDAMIAAFASWQVARDPSHFVPRDWIDRLEARILV